MQEISLKITNPEKHISTPSVARKTYTEPEKQKIAKASRDFESLLTTMMIKSMNKTTGGMFGDSGFGGDVFDTVFEQEMAGKFSENRGLGIASDLYRKIIGEELFPNSTKLTPLNISEKQENSVNKIEATSQNQNNIKKSPSASSLKKLNKFEPIISKVSQKYGLNKNLIRSVILTESAGNEKAVSSAGAKGLMQLMDSTSTDMGVKNAFDPIENIHGGTKYLAKMLKRYNGDVELSLAAYNAGPGNVDKYNGVPPFDETQNYIKRIKEYINYFEG